MLADRAKIVTAILGLTVPLSMAVVGCSPTVVNTDDVTKTQEETVTTTSAAVPNNAKLLNAFDYYTSAEERSGYYFSTPSGNWRCVIVPKTWAGCQSATGTGKIAVKGAPQTVTDDDGDSVAPNAIAVRTMGNPQFTSFPAERFKSPNGPSKVVPYNMILAAAGFHCNVQQKVGVSCISEETNNGFTFSNDGASWQYTDIPPG